ncbi:uncharacterized protein LOC122873373 isoform X13 [Siniperca chuatsi]|uniref:uncharacterized protein LOC122873373 isoform X13 n=1 Tax=Siniperca chuatsi TaxID=119488 RepID=UPI001CE22DFE|nr:uncharacterized protein LOC122873373 isoform X13 [Siniperca chuatsi]
MLGFCLTDTTDTYLSFGSLRSGSVWVCEDRVTEYEMRTTPSELKLLASVLGTCNAPKKSEDRTGLSLGETCPGTVSPIVLGDDLCQMTGRGQQRLKKQVPGLCQDPYCQKPFAQYPVKSTHTHTYACTLCSHTLVLLFLTMLHSN